MNIPVNFAKWSASNLPAGLKLKNGVISGQPTGETGIYTVPFSVATPWGRDTKNITINVREKLKFAVYQNGAKLEDISLNDLIASIRNGTAQEKYNCTNTQIMIPVVTPALKYEYKDTTTNQTVYAIRPSQIDTVAVNFCSFRNVTLADGTVKPALILQFDKTIWRGFCCFDTGDTLSGGLENYREDNIYDNSDTALINSITNRWKYSNLRQWLNSAGVNWFTPAYNTDVLITFDNTMEYVSLMRNSNSIGFLSCLPEDLVENIQPIKIQTQAFFNENNFDESIEEPEIIDDVYVDTTYDKIFIPSLEEMNIKPSDNDGYSGSKKLYADDGIEGSAWEYYVNKFGSQSRVISGTTINDINEWGKSLSYDFDTVFFQKKYGHFTRSANLLNQEKTWGIIVNKDNNNINIVEQRAECDGDSFNALYTQPAPAFALC